MSLAVGAVPSCSKINMGLGDDKQVAAEDKNKTPRPEEESEDEGAQKIGGRQRSESSIDATDGDDDDNDEPRHIQLGPQCTLKAQLEKDKVKLNSSS